MKALLTAARVVGKYDEISFRACSAINRKIDIRSSTASFQELQAAVDAYEKRLRRTYGTEKSLNDERCVSEKVHSVGK